MRDVITGFGASPQWTTVPFQIFPGARRANFQKAEQLCKNRIGDNWGVAHYNMWKHDLDVLVDLLSQLPDNDPKTTWVTVRYDHRCGTVDRAGNLVERDCYGNTGVNHRIICAAFPNLDRLASPDADEDTESTSSYIIGGVVAAAVVLLLLVVTALVFAARRHRRKMNASERKTTQQCKGDRQEQRDGEDGELLEAILSPGGGDDGDADALKL